MLNNFIYAETKNLFLEHLDSGNILDEAIVFIADTKEIWNHGTYFAGDCGFDQNTIDLIQAAISDIELNKLDKVTAEGLYATKTELPNLELYITKEEADIKYASASDVEEVQSQLENNFATKEFVETEIEKSKSKISSIPITEDLFIFEKEEGTERTMMMEGHVQESRLQEVLSADALEFEGCILSKKNEPLFSSYTVFSGTFLFGVMDEAYVTVMISEDGQFTLTMYLLKKDGDFSASSWDEVEIDNDRKDIFRQNFGFLYELGSHMFEEQSLPLYNDDSRTLTEEYRAIVYNCLGLKIEDNEFIRIAKYDNYSVFQLIWASGISESDSTTMVIETLLVYKDGGVTRQRRTVVNDNRIANAISNSVTFTDSEKQSFKENLGITNNEGGLKVFELTEDKIESLNDEEQKIILKSEYAETAYNSDVINVSGEATVFKATNISDDIRLFVGSVRVTSSEAMLFIAYVSMTGEISIVNASEKYPFVYEGDDDGKVQRRLTLLDLSLPHDSNKQYTEHLDEVIANVKKNLGIENGTSPFEKGEGENSAVLKGGNNIAGLMGYKFDKYYYDGERLYLYAVNSNTDVNSLTKLDTIIDATDTSFTIEYNIGAPISIITNGQHNRFVGTVEVVDYNKVIIYGNNLIFNETDNNALEIDNLWYSFFSIENPKIGNVALTHGSTAIGILNESYGEGSIALGYNNIALISGSFASGFETNSLGLGSHTEGVNTTSYGVGSHTEGVSTINARNILNNKSIEQLNEGDKQEIIDLWESEKDFSITFGSASHNEGKDNLNTGYVSHSEGMQTHADGYHAHTEGKGTYAKHYAHAEGQDTKAIGNQSHTEGFRTIANNPNEHAQGKYNVSNEGTIHSIGVGSYNDRKNAVEVMDNGDVYVMGIGGYRGNNDFTNPTDSCDSLSDILEGVNWNNIRKDKIYANESSLGTATASNLHVYDVVSAGKLRTGELSSGNLTVSGTATFETTLNVKNNTRLDKGLYVGGYDGENPTSNKGSLKVNGSAIFENAIYGNSGLKIASRADLQGNTFIGTYSETTPGSKKGNLYVNGAINAVNSITTDGAINVNGPLNANGNINLGQGIATNLVVKTNTTRFDTDNIYIKGIGGYDGTNLDTAKSVQEVINELVNKLNEITTND